MLSNDIKNTLLSKFFRDWVYTKFFCIFIALFATLYVCGYVYQSYAHSVRPLPIIHLEGVDPAVRTAIEQAQVNVQKTPRTAETWGKLGMVLLVHEFANQAILCFSQAEELGPHDVRWPYYQSLAEILRGNLDDAKIKLERALVLGDDKYDGPRLLLADVLVGLEKFEEAKSHYTVILQKYPRHARASLGLCRVGIKCGNTQESLNNMSVIEGNPYTRRSACELLAQVHDLLGDHAAAEADRRRAVELPADQKWPDPLRDELAAYYTGKVAWLRQANDHEEHGRLNEALALLQRAVHDYPDADDAWFALGKALYQRKMLQPAEDALRRACLLAPATHEPINQLGMVLVARNNRTEALHCFRRALELKPDSAQVWHNLGSCLLGAGDRAGALDAYTQAVHFAPQIFESQFAMAVLLNEKGHSTEAYKHAELAQQLNPNHQPTRNLLEQLRPNRGTVVKPGS